MNRFFLRRPFWLLALTAVACASPDRLTAPEAAFVPPSGADVISDGQTGGNPHFFLLPPLVKAPTASGAFDASLAPVVRITDGGVTIAELPAAVDTTAELYHANWHTGRYDLDPARTYRITVFARGHALGFADVDVVSNGSGLRNVNTAEYVGLVDGRTLPIKFRIERGALPTGWRLLASTDAGRRGLSGIAHDVQGQAVFAAAMPDFASGSLWRFDLATDTWRQLRADAWPIGKYRKLVHDPVNRRLLTFWDGIGRVYAIPDTGGAWSSIGGDPNRETHYEGFAFWDPVAERLTHFAGYGWFAFRDELTQFDASTGAWVVRSQSAARPAPTFGFPNVTTLDAARGRIFLGGRWRGATGGEHDDLWALELATGAWTNIVPASTGADSRVGSGFAFEAGTATLYRFGGIAMGGAAYDATLRRLGVDAPAPTWETIVPSGSAPSPRYMPALIHDAPRHRLVLVSGVNAGWIDDVWAYHLP